MESLIEIAEISYYENYFMSVLSTASSTSQNILHLLDFGYHWFMKKAKDVQWEVIS